VGLSRSLVFPSHFSERTAIPSITLRVSPYRYRLKSIGIRVSAYELSHYEYRLTSVALRASAYEYRLASVGLDECRLRCRYTIILRVSVYECRLRRGVVTLSSTATIIYCRLQDVSSPMRTQHYLSNTQLQHLTSPLS